MQVLISRNRQADQDASAGRLARACDSIFTPHSPQGHRTLRMFRGHEGLNALGATSCPSAQQARFHATIASCRYGALTLGIVRHTPHVSVEPTHNFGHNHPVSRLAVMMSGNATGMVDQQEVRLTPGTGLLIPGNVPFTYEAKDEVTKLYVDISTDDPVFSGIGEAGRVAYWQKRSPVMTALAAFTQTLLRKDDSHTSHGERSEVRRALEALVLSILASAPPLNPQVLDDSTYGRALDYIRRHHTDPMISATAVARAVGVSIRTLQRAFEHSRSASQWITQFRTDTALSLLRDHRFANLTMDDVAQRAGFGSTVGLRRAVLAATGLAPSEVRLRYLRSAEYQAQTTNAISKSTGSLNTAQPSKPNTSSWKDNAAWPRGSVVAQDLSVGN